MGSFEIYEIAQFMSKIAGFLKLLKIEIAEF